MDWPRGLGAVFLFMIGACAESRRAPAPADAAAPTPTVALATSSGPEVEPFSGQTLVQPQYKGGFRQVLVDGDAIWALDTDGVESELVRVSLSDRRRTVVAQHILDAHLVGATSTSIVFTRECDSIDQACVMVATVPGDKPRQIARAHHDGGGGCFAADQDAVYFADRTATSLVLKRIAHAGGKSTTLSSRALVRKQSRAEAIAVDAVYAYWVIDWSLLRVDKTRGGAATSLTEGHSLFSPASDGEYVYWAEGRWGHALRRVAATGGDVETVVSSPILSPSGIVLDSTHVYWTDEPELGAARLYRTAKPHGLPEKVAPNGVVPDSLTADATHVYWIDAKSRAIMAAPK